MPTPHDRSVALLKDLVSIPSPSGRESAAACLLAARLPALGWEAVTLDEAGNVVASRGTGEKEFVLLGHIDTVPGGPAARLEGETLWGRGSVDAKGPLCAFAVAGGRAGVPPGWRLTLVAAVGEETDSRGARFRVPLHAPAACLVGEPSGTDGITLAYRGYLQVRLTASDSGSHRSSGTSPLSACVQAAADILRAVGERDDPRKAVIDRMGANVLAMSGTEEGNRSARVELDIRLPLGADPAGLFRFFQATAKARGVEAESACAIPAYAADRGNPVIRALRVAIREHGGTPRLLAKGGTADFNLAAAWNCPMAAWGPGDSRLDHTCDERLELTEYAASITVLSAMFPAFFSFSPG